MGTSHEFSIVKDTHLDACLRLISDRQRREILQQLRHESDGKTGVDELVTQLHGSDTARSRGQGSQEQVAIELVHNHLPKLADHGLVEIDPENEIVRYQSDEQVEALLDALPRELTRSQSP